MEGTINVARYREAKWDSEKNSGTFVFVWFLRFSAPPRGDGPDLISQALQLAQF